MKKIIVIAILSVISLGLTAQNQKPVYSSNESLNFNKFTSGVKYASIALNAPGQEMVDKNTGMAGFYLIAQKYLYNIGFEYVALTSAEKTELEMSVKSYCDYTQVFFGGDIGKNSISNLSMTYISCNGDVFAFSSDKKLSYKKIKKIEKNLIANLTGMVQVKPKYQDKNRLSLPINKTEWTREAITQYLTTNKNKLDPIEGIYERLRMSMEDLTGGKYLVGVIKDPEQAGYLVIYLSGATNSVDWQPGEVKATFEKTATPSFYSVNWITRDKSLYNDVYCSLDPMGFSVVSSGVIELAYKFIKLLPSQDKSQSNKLVQSFNTDY